MQSICRYQSSLRTWTIWTFTGDSTLWAFNKLFPQWQSPSITVIVTDHFLIYDFLLLFAISMLGCIPCVCGYSTYPGTRAVIAAYPLSPPIHWARHLTIKGILMCRFRTLIAQNIVKRINFCIINANMVSFPTQKNRQIMCLAIMGRQG